MNKTILRTALTIVALSGLTLSTSQAAPQARETAVMEIKEGSEAPDFTLPDLDGKDVSLSSLRGKWVLLDFWGSWCKWCMIGVPQMKENYEIFKNDCYFVGIDCRDSREAWRACVEKNGMNWIQLYNDESGDKSVSRLYGVKGYPTKMLVDPEGKIAYICVGEEPEFYNKMGALIGFAKSPMAPVKTATQPSDSYIGLSLLPDGEIRHYNYGEQAEAGTFYISSIDGGKTWKKVNYPKEMPYADRQSPKSGEYIRLVNMGRNGVYSIRTEGGLNGNRTLRKVDSIGSIMIKPPVFTKGGNRIVVAAHGGVTPKGSYTYVSDDDGLTWRRSNTVTAPDHVKGGFHKGTRWNHGAVEPTVVELEDGRLWMLMRTSQDYHYQSFSNDGGLTWSESEPSTFYGTITMPTIGRLQDGRLLLIWTNTTPLPEMESADGVWDDVFTNRDVTHAAVSDDDGKTWHGFRELMLDPLRNESDYALRGRGIDRGMHQSQFVEPTPGRIVAAIGQHPLHRGIVAFDVDWLLEEGRSDDFSQGTANWSTFNYIDGIKGHCSYNRIEGTKAVAHPDKDGRKALWLHYEKADSLVSDVRGAVWNFPAAKKGEFKTSIKVPDSSENIFLILNDRWMNPSDTISLSESQFVVSLSRRNLGIKDDKWHEVKIDWNLDSPKPSATVYIDGKRRRNINLNRQSPHGISYAHFIAVPAEENEGVYVERVETKKT